VEAGDADGQGEADGGEQGWKDEVDERRQAADWARLPGEGRLDQGLGEATDVSQGAAGRGRSRLSAQGRVEAAEAIGAFVQGEGSG